MFAALGAWRPSPWRPFFGDSSGAVERLTSVSWPDDGALAAARPLRGGDGRHHDVASRCGITMRHHSGLQASPRCGGEAWDFAVMLRPSEVSVIHSYVTCFKLAFSFVFDLPGLFLSTLI